MKSRILAVLVLFAAVAAAAWWLLGSTSKAPEKPGAASVPMASAASPTPAAPAVPVPQAPRVELPTAPFPANLAVATPASASTRPSAVVDRGDLNSVIPECLRLLEAQDVMGAVNLLMPPDAREHLPPGKTIEEMIQEPSFVEKMADLQVALKAIKGQTPTFNDAGDRATYTLDTPVRSHNDITFVKVDGNWYLR